MTDIHCTYSDNRDEMLVAYLYDDITAADRAAFDAHLQTCARCRTELAALGGVREQLARWNPPEPKLTLSGPPSTSDSGSNDIRWWQQIPAWAQVAAAVLVLGASIGMANIEVRYDGNGLSVRSGWMAPSAVPSAAPAGVTRDELVALEQRLRSQMSDQQPAIAVQARGASDEDRTRALIADSERRQKNELAQRLAEIVREVEAERQADLVTIDRNFGVLRSGTMTVDQQQRALMNYVATRVSQQK